MAAEINTKSLEVYEDSKLVINQLLLNQDIKKDNLILDFQYDIQLLGRFESVRLEHLPRSGNPKTDAFANLKPALALSKDESMEVQVCNLWLVPLLIVDQQVENNSQ